MPKAIILVGPPCSGKTTYARKLKDYTHIEAAHTLLWPEDKKLITLGIKGRQNIVVDALNHTIRSRQYLLKKFNTAGYSVACVEFGVDDVNLGQSGYLNAIQSSGKYDDVSLLKIFQEWESPSLSEGFSMIDHVNIYERRGRHA